MPIYLDYNATTPHDPGVIDAMLPFLSEHFGNPSSPYMYGVQTKEAVEDARQRVSSLLNCDPSEVVFTSGGTESNNYAVKGVALFNKKKGNHIITTQIEHPAVLEVCRNLEKNGFEVTYLPVDEYGIVRVDDVEKAIDSTLAKTILITVMHANNEVGSVQPVEEISALAKERGITVHTDAAQSVGKIPVDVKQLGVDLLSVAGHKVYAPKGIGVLYIRKGVGLSNFIHGAGQEQGRRPGTENVPGIVGLGRACEIAREDLTRNMIHMREMRDRLYAGLKSGIGEVKLNGHPGKRLPNTLSLSFKGLPAHSILSKIMDKVAASPGAACHSDKIKISHVLEAMNIPEEWAGGTIRFSTGRMTTEEEIEYAVEIITNAVTRFT